MGIPKFFRYVSERWPMISQLVNESQVPEFDNLYLDMNSILHTCTHKDTDATHHLTEEEMFVAIFNYIEHLFSLIKPQKVFYMAIDGVAPRAKMNQQRARRFRTALDMENSRKKAQQEGHILPEDPFDSNSITPGTEFMAKLTVQLKYFINKKVSEDVDWQGIDVILSGHEVPGEGEHKIMDYIRTARAKPDYDSNLRHCLYGLDADLIMLGMLSHDPHFALLREEVTFGRTKKSKELTEQNFFLLHLSLVREYMELEYEDIKGTLSFDFDFERVLDDFILINYFIGNDFLPELPSLLINTGALPILMDAYKRTLHKIDGYLTHNGEIHIERLGVWLDEISAYELEQFEAQAVDAEWMNEELDTVGIKGPNNPKLTLSQKEKELLRLLKPFILQANHDGKTDENNPPKIDLPKWVGDEHMGFLQALCGKSWTRIVNDNGKWSVVLDIDGIPDEEDDDEADNRMMQLQKTFRVYEKAPVEKDSEVQTKKESYNVKFTEWKQKYYKDKFKLKRDEDMKEITDIAHNYLEGLQWVLYYYYTGCASWSWFYRYHYAPCISDIKMALKTPINFDLSAPFRPFEQLMGVLPERSKKLVPQAYWQLMGDELSPIRDFYPHQFELDMNGKKNDWEAVVKIPFVDAKRLLDALATKEKDLSADEKARNSFGKEVKFVFNPQTNFVYPSSMPGTFEDLTKCHCIMIDMEKNQQPKKIKTGLMENAKLGTEALAGFPSLKTIPFQAKLEKAGVTVFQQESRNESMTLTLTNTFADETSTSLAEKLVGDTVFIGWPYLREAKVVAISDKMMRYEKLHGKVAGEPHDGKLQSQLPKTMKRIEDNYGRKGVKIGKVEYLVHVKKLKGLMRTSQGAYVKEFGGPYDEEVDEAVQTMVEEVVHEDERFKERPALPITEEYPKDSKAVYLGPDGFGLPVKVLDHVADGDKMKIEVTPRDRPEPQIGAKAALAERRNIRYFPSYEIAKRLQIHPLLLSKITSKFLVEGDGKKYDVGLCLKFEARRLKVLGYSRKGQRGWDFSTKAIELIDNYKTTFPRLFATLTQNVQNSNIPDMKKVWGMDGKDVKSELDGIRSWIKKNTIDLEDFESASLESDGLSGQTIKALEKNVVAYFEAEGKPVQPKIHNNVPRHVLLAPTHAYHQLRSQWFDLGDRVVSALNFGKVKLFERGTVVSINSQTTKITLDVLFDNEFNAGTSLNGKCETKRGLTVDAGSVVNLTRQQLVYQTKKQMERKQQQNKQQKPAFNASAGPSKNAWNPNPNPKPKPKPKPQQGKVQILTPQQSQRPQPQPQPQQQAPVDNEQASKELMTMLNSGGKAKPKKTNDEALASITGKHSAQSQRNLMGAVLGQYGGGGPPPPPPHPMMPPPPFGMAPPPPPPPGAFPPIQNFAAPPFIPQGMPMPPPPPPPQQQQPQAKDQDSAALMAQLNIGGNGGNGGNRGRGRGRGRGNGRGRGRGRGRGDKEKAPES